MSKSLRLLFIVCLLSLAAPVPVIAQAPLEPPATPTEAEGWSREEPSAPDSKVDEELPPPASTAAPSTLPQPSIDARDFLSKTEAFVRAPRATELLPLGRELRDRGFNQAADLVFESLPSTGEELAPLVQQCLQTGQLAAAEEVLARWRRSDPRSGRAALYLLVLLFAQGQTELALRELATAGDLATPEEKPVVELLAGLLRLQMRGQQPGIDANPWEVQFTGAEGKYTAGSIDPEQAKKIPPEATDAMLRLVNLTPKQGNLWALLGELLNASGDPSAALRCLDRARILLYTPPLLREHLRVLEEYQRQADEQARAAMDQSLPAESEEPPPAFGWSNLTSRRDILVILVVGAVLGIAIVILQLREWTKPSRKS